MATQIIAILCEGPHDVAFIARILKFNGYKSYDSTKIKDFPAPINEFLKIEISKANVEGLNLHEVRQVLLPSSTLVFRTNYFLLYSMGGDSKIGDRKRLLNDFFSFIPKENEISTLPEDTTFSVLYFLDSDKKGILTRVNELNIEIEEVLGIRPFTNHKEIYRHLELVLGTFIFSGTDNNKGKLEDILLPLMEDNNNNIFTEARDYINRYFDAARVGSFDLDKSIIGTVGQLQISGASNVVCISKSDYLNKEKVLENPKCQEIFEYINSLVI